MLTSPSPSAVRTFTIFVILLFTVAMWVTQNEISKKERRNLGYTLNTVLNTSHQAIRSWLKAHKSAAKLWANSPEIRSATQQLLALSQQPQQLLTSDAQAYLRTWFQPLKQAMGYQGYFIIAPNNISLASSRDQNVGQKTPLLQQPEMLQRIREGETIASTPQHSQVPLPDKTGELQENSPTLFIGTPILDDNGKIIAIFTFRLNLGEDFTAIFQQGRVGKTGETYAFDKQARLISNSRFDHHLHQAGLVSTGKEALLNVDIRDPGVNLLTGEQATLPRAQQPFTLMAAAAIKGRAGMNLEGYRDYRGVPVVGAWLWDQDLGFGITAEQDVAEAYSSFYATRNTFYFLYAILVLLSLSTMSIYNQKQRRQQAEEQFRALIKSTPDALVVVNTNGTIVLINHQAELMFDYEQDELLGKCIETLIPDRYKNTHITHRHDYALDPKIRRMGAEFNLYAMKKNGTKVPVEISLSHFKSYEGLLIASAIRDISERLKTEAQLAKYRNDLENLVAQRTAALTASNKELEAYSHSIAHDLRQPLRAITGFSQILIADAFDRLNADEKDCLNRISSAGMKMSRLIEDMLELSRITRCNFHSAMVDLSDLSQKIVTKLEQSQPERVVLIQIQEDLSAKCDAKLAGIALLHLFDNAWKFTQESSTAKIEFGCQSSDGKSIFFIRDNGVGFDMKYNASLFKPFQHPHAATQQEVTGVGLAMAQRAIQRHGGKIWAESTLGKGSTFYFTFK